MILYRFFVAAVVIILIVIPSNAVQAGGDDNPMTVTSVPREMSYQAILRDSAGDPVVDSIYSVTFRIFDVSTGGTSLWDETLPCTTTAGVFNAMFSNVSLPFDVDYWLELEIDTEILDPRQKMGMVGYSAVSDTADYAQRVATVDGATGGTISGDVSIQSNLSVDGNIDATGKATIGTGHTNSGTDAFVAGYANTASGYQSKVGGGAFNTASGGHSAVAGGSSNTAGDSISFVGGGNYNTASSYGSAIGGGGNNLANNMNSTIAGGYGNTASGEGSSISGGYINTASGNQSAVGGGESNTASGLQSTIAGGYAGTASGENAALGGGWHNYVSGSVATVAGGQNDTASGAYAVVAGGNINVASGWGSAVAGGESNTASGQNSMVGGGSGNTAGAYGATVAGGANNGASLNYSTVGGGNNNTANAYQATIAGGTDNTASATASSIGGGNSNATAGTYSTVSGGISNSADGDWSVVGGGSSNTASGFFSTIPGGQLNVAQGSYSFAAGRKAKANHNGAFVWGDDTDADFASTGDDQFLIRASGGVGIGIDNPTSALHVNGEAKCEVGGVEFFMVPRGAIIMWSGLLADIPSGWALCDGTNGTPNLSDRFIYSVHSGENPGGTGGSASIPAHNHTVDISPFNTGAASHSWYGGSPNISRVPDYNHYHSADPPATISTANGSASIIPPYYKLAFIMKL